MSAGRAEILVVGGYGEVGRLLAKQLECAYPGCVVVGGRNPERATSVRARHIDVDDVASIEVALDGVATVVACVRQREPHLLRAAVRRGLAYTSIAPPPMDWPGLEPLRTSAPKTGARVIVGAGIEPGISSILARELAKSVGEVDSIETALLLAVGDNYGADSMAFILDEIGERYVSRIDGQWTPTYAFERAKRIEFPPPFGPRHAFTMPFTDHRYYPMTLGARTSIARIALDPPWLGPVLSLCLRLGVRARLGRKGGRRGLHEIMDRLRRRYAGRDHFSLVVEMRGMNGRFARATLYGHQQARATATSAAATTEALHAGEVSPGVWLAEEAIAPAPFLARIAKQGLIPTFEEGTLEARNTDSARKRNRARRFERPM